MSRTIRRKNSHLRFDHISRPEQVDQWALRRHGAHTAQQVINHETVRFHGDNHAGRWNAPSWYARELNKKVSRQNRHEIHRCMTQGCWDDHAPDKHLRNANWNWW